MPWGTPQTDSLCTERCFFTSKVCNKYQEIAMIVRLAHGPLELGPNLARCTYLDVRGIPTDVDGKESRLRG